MKLENFYLEEVKKDTWTFSIKAVNSKVLLSSGTYDDQEKAFKDMLLVEKTSHVKSLYERKTSKEGKFFFNFLSPSGKVLASSGSYSTEYGMENGIQSVIKHGKI